MTFSQKVKDGLQAEYTSNLVHDFYRPLLREATKYQRVSGFFSTSGVDLYADGLEELAKNNGTVQFIVSKEISESDFKQIKAGYRLLDEIAPLKIAEQNELLTTEAQQKLGNLAFLIASRRARVKVALTRQGLFHDKFGIISSDDECVFFSGSANETKNGFTKNYESITVDNSWDESLNVQNRITAYKNRFKRLWNNVEDDVTVIEASELAYEEIAKYQDQSTISEPLPEAVDQVSVFQSPGVVFGLENNVVRRVDNTVNHICNSDRKLRSGSDIARLFESDNEHMKATSTYKDVENAIEVTQSRVARRDSSIIVTVTSALKDFLTRSRYSIRQYQIMGDVLKSPVSNFPEIKQAEFQHFASIVQNEVTRPLRPLHLRAAYYEYEMARAANFSVPGAGKTAMLLGVFAYLNSNSVQNSERVNRMLVICPINAFESWRREFRAVFGEKKKLYAIDSQTSKDFSDRLLTDWSVSNLVIINYESLPRYANQIRELLDSKTMLIYDEVHRIKNPSGKWAKAALSIANTTLFRYVMTGTPIPNTYQDIYNFLHILYANEYQSFFGWNPRELVNPSVRSIEAINQAIHPFFWRTNKKDLDVPPASPDIVKVVNPSREQVELAETIYANETSSLAILIRLIQASTNPELLLSSINYDELMAYDEGDGSENSLTSSISKREFDEMLDQPVEDANKGTYEKLKVQSMVAPKFIEGINQVVELVEQNKKVMVWGIFVNTLEKITQALTVKGVRVNLVYGGTPKDERVSLIDEFRDGDVQVLVSNPQTLGESISLHQAVHDAVYFEYNFNLTFMLQSRDRIHRLGLKPNQYTRYYYLQTKGEDAYSNTPGYIDEKIYLRLKDKEQVMYSVIDDNTLSVEYSKSEILDAIKIIDKERERITRNDA